MTNNNSTYKRLGDYIREVDVRNKDLQCSNLLGLSIAKKFIPSIANMVGTDLKSYKIVKHSQFAYVPVTSRNGEKITVALYDKDEDCVISQAYTSFEIVDHNALMPDYLMMWFRRPEFDRYARFHSHGSAREVFEWDEMCNVMLPVPSINEQRSIVSRYKAIENRIANNKQTIAKLEEAAQALYRKMFVDDVDVENLPEGWRMGTLGEVCEVITKGTTPSTINQTFIESGIFFFKGECISDSHKVNRRLLSFINEETNKLLKRSIINQFDILFSIAGTLGKFCFVDSRYLPANTNQAVAIIRAAKSKISPFALYGFFLGGFFDKYCRENIQQAVQANLSLTTISNIPLILPDHKAMESFESKVETIIKQVILIDTENEKLTEMLSVVMA